MKEKEYLTEPHPLPPFFPKGARLLLLGSFPPPRSRWSMEFYYPNFQNDMWRIFGMAFFEDKDHFLNADKKSFCEQRIRDFLTATGIALTDSGQEVVRQKANASDKFLDIRETIDLRQVLQQLPDCIAIAATGQKATDTLLTLVEAKEPKIGTATACVYAGRRLQLYRMPSSSRAYPKPLAEKAAAYKKMFEALQMTGPQNPDEKTEP